MRVLGIGDNTVDIYCDRGVRFPGGNAVNVAALARRLGAEAGYLGCIGDDVYGEAVRAALAAEGVDLARLRRIDGPNAWCRIRHDGADRRFEASSPGVRGRYDFVAADGPYIASFDLAHTSAQSDIEADLAFVARHARRLSCDYSEKWRRPDKAATFGLVDIAFASFPGASDADCAATIAALRAGGVKDCVVVTRGASGAAAGRGGEVIFERVRPAAVVDTLGAGDGFIAGFLLAWLVSNDLRAALAAGADNAARVCGHHGAFGHGRPIGDDDPAAGFDAKAR